MAFDKPKFDIKQPTNSKNWLTDQLSTAGGIGGSLGGAALGTAILPGVGTIIGGVLGGALGSGAGELGENVITGEKDAFKNVGKEALIGGVTGVPIFGAAKGAIGASKALLSGAGKTAANEALAAALKVGTGTAAKGAAKAGASTLANAGKNIVSDVLGIKTGAKLAGKGILKPQYIDDLSNFVSKQVTGKTPSAANVLINTQNYADDIGKSIAEKIGSSKIVINGADVSGDIIKNLQKNLLPTDDAVVKGVLDRLKTAKTPSELWELRKVIDDKISWIANPDAATSNMNAIAHTIRDTLNKQLDKVGVQSLNKEYSLAQDAIKLLQKPALSPAGLQIGKMNIGGAAAQRAQIAGGRALSGFGTATQEIASRIPQGLIGTSVRQIGGRALTGQDQGTPETISSPMAISSYSTPSLFRQQAFGETATPVSQAQTTTASPFGVSTDQLAQALMMAYASGDTASAKQLQNMYELSASIDKSTSTKSLSEAQQSRVDVKDLTQSALDMLAGGNIKTGLISAPLENIKGTFGVADQETLAFNTLISNLKATIAKARAGTSFTAGEKKMLEQYTPNVGDSKQQLLTKLYLLQQQFGGETPNVTSLEDSLINASSR